MEDPQYTKALYDHLSPKLNLGTQADFDKQINSDDAFRKAIYEQASVDLNLGDYKTYEGLVKKKVTPADYGLPSKEVFSQMLGNTTRTIPKDEATTPQQIGALEVPQNAPMDFEKAFPNLKQPKNPFIQPTESTSILADVKPMPKIPTLGDYLNERGVTLKQVGLPENINTDRQLRDGEEDGFNSLLKTKGVAQPMPTSYFWGAGKEVHKVVSSVMRDFDDASKVIADVTGLKRGGGFKDIADFVDQRSEGILDMPDTEFGRLLSGGIGLESLFAEMAISSEFKMGKIFGKALNASKFLTQMTGKGFVNKYAAEVDKDEEGKPLLEGLKGAGEGALTATVFTKLGYGSSKLGQAIAKATGSGAAGGIANVIANSTGFAGYTLAEMVATGRPIDENVIRNAGELGAVLAIPQFAQFAGMRATGNYLTSSPAAEKAAKDMKLTIPEARDKAFDIREQARTETDFQKQAAQEASANTIDALADIKVILEEVKKDPVPFIETVEKSGLPPEQQKVLKDKIDATVADGVITPEIDKVNSDIESLKGQEKALKENEQIPEEVRKLKAAPLKEQINAKLDELKGLLNPEELKAPEDATKQQAVDKSLSDLEEAVRPATPEEVKAEPVVEETKPQVEEVAKQVNIDKNNVVDFIKHLENGGKLTSSDLIDMRLAVREYIKEKQDALYDRVSKGEIPMSEADPFKGKLGKQITEEQFAIEKLINKQPNPFGLEGDINSESAFHFTDSKSLLNILSDNHLYGDGGETSGVSTTTNKAFDHPELTNVQFYGEGNKPTTFANKGIRIDLDLQQLKNDGIKIKAGNETIGTFIGEEELRIGGRDGIKDASKYIKQIQIDRKIVDDKTFAEIKTEGEKLGIKIVEKTDYERPRNKTVLKKSAKQEPIVQETPKVEAEVIPETVSEAVKEETKYAIQQETFFDPINKQVNAKPFTILDKLTDDILRIDDNGNIVEKGKGLRFKTEKEAQKYLDKLNRKVEETPIKVVQETAQVVAKKLDKQSAIKDDKIFKEQKNQLLDDLIQAEDILLGSNKENVRKTEEDAGGKTDQPTLDAIIQDHYEYKLDALPKEIEAKLNKLGIKVRDGKLVVDIYKDGTVEVGDIRTALRMIDKGFPTRIKELRMPSGPGKQGKTQIRHTAESYGSLAEAERRVKVAEDNLAEAQRTDRTKKVGDKIIPIEVNKGLVRTMEEQLAATKVIHEEAKYIGEKGYERIRKENKMDSDKEFMTLWEENKDTFSYLNDYQGREKIYDIIEKQGRPEKLTYDTVQPLIIKDSLEEQKKTIPEKRKELTDNIDALNKELQETFGRKDGKGLRKPKNKSEEFKQMSLNNQVRKAESELNDLNEYEPAIKKLYEKQAKEQVKQPDTTTDAEKGNIIPAGTEAGQGGTIKEGEAKPVTTAKVEKPKEPWQMTPEEYFHQTMVDEGFMKGAQGEYTGVINDKYNEQKGEQLETLRQSAYKEHDRLVRQHKAKAEPLQVAFNKLIKETLITENPEQIFKEKFGDNIRKYIEEFKKQEGIIDNALKETDETKRRVLKAAEKQLKYFVDQKLENSIDYQKRVLVIKYLEGKLELTEPKVEQGFTPKEVINKGYNEVKSKLGKERVQEYFRQVDRLFNPNKTTIAEYRFNGVVVKDGDKYIFHALAGMETKTWRVAGKFDVTKQFETPKITDQDKIKILANGIYQKAIANGKMTATEAKKIIEDAGVEVPKDILDLASKEVAPVQTKAEELKAKEEELKNKIAGNIDDLMSSIGGVKKFTGDQRATVIKSLVELMDNLGKLTLLKGEQLWERVKQDLKDRKIVIPDDVFKEAQDKYEGVSSEVKTGLVEGSHFTNANGERFENGEEVVFPSITGEKKGLLDIPEGKAPGLKVEGGVLPLTMADMERLRKTTAGEKTPVPPKGTPKEAEPLKGDEKYRKTQVNALIQDRTLQQQTVAEIVTANKEKYTVLHGEDAIVQAKKMIDEKGVQGAALDLSEPTKHMDEFPIRQVGRQILLDFYSRAIIDKNAAETDKEIAFRYIDSLQQITAREATKAGQGNSLLQIWKSMQPAGLLEYVKRKIDQANNKILDKRVDDTTIGKQIDELYNTLTAESKKIIDDILAGKQITLPKEDTGRPRIIPDKKSVPRDRIKKEQDYRKNLIEQYKKSYSGTMALSVTGLTSAQIEFGGNLLGSYVREGYYRTKAAVDNLIKDFKEIGVALNEKQANELLGHQKDNKETYGEFFDRKESETRIRAGEKFVSKNITEVLREHWSVKDELKRTLAQKLMDEAGLTEVEAKKLEKDILKTFDEEMLKRSQKQLTKILGTERIPVVKTKKGLADNMIELINMGALDEGLYRDLFAEKFKLGKLTDEHKMEILKLANNLQEVSNKGWLERDASMALAKYIYELYPKSRTAEILETWIGMTYANVLWGPSTTILNLWSQGWNMSLRPIRNVGNFSKWLRAVKRGVKGEGFDIYNPFGEMFYVPMLRGTNMGLNAAKEVYVNGDLNNKYVEDIAKKGQFKVSPLERDKFGPAKRFRPLNVKIAGKTYDLNLFNGYKYSARNLAAQDKAMLTTTYDVEIVDILRDKLRTKDLTGRALTREVMKIYKGEHIDYEQLDATLKSDIELHKRLTGDDMSRIQIKIRRRELELEQLPLTKEEKLEAEKIGRGNIFTDDRGGAIATLAEGIGMVANKTAIHGALIKPFIMFTKIVGNVTEYMLDHTPGPYGFMRANGISFSALKKIGNPDAKTAQLGPRGSRLYYEQMGRAWMGNLAFATAMALAFGNDEDDFIEISGGYDPEGFKKEGRANVLPKYTLRIGKVKIPYLNIPGLAIPLGLIGNLNDGLKAKQDEGDLRDRFTLALLFDATLHTVTMAKDMSFVQGVQNLTTTVTDVLATDAKKLEKFGQALLQTYLGFALRPLPQNNNAVQQIWKVFDPTAYSQSDIKSMLAYTAGVQHFFGKPKLDQFGDVVKTYPGETLLPYTHWLGLKGKDKRWQFLAKYNAIPNKIVNHKLNIETKDGLEPRRMDEDELFDYTDRTGILFSNAVKGYMSNNEKVSKRGTEIIERAKINGEIENISGVREDMEKLWEKAKDNAEVELFRWGSVKEEIPKVWDLIKKHQAYQLYQTTKSTDGYTWSKSELYEFNNMASLHYAAKMEQYLSSDDTVNADKKNIDKEGVSKFEKKMDKEWNGLSKINYTGAKEWAAGKMAKRIKASIKEDKIKSKK